MKRIGIAASKICRGHLWLYNTYVVLISLLFSVFIFIVAGTTVLFALIIMANVSVEVMGRELQEKWFTVFTICMAILSMIVFFFNLVAISTNLKFRKS